VFGCYFLEEVGAVFTFSKCKKTWKPFEYLTEYESEKYKYLDQLFCPKCQKEETPKKLQRTINSVIFD